MRGSWKTTAAVAIGVAALGSGAYAVGTQVGGGDASASGSGRSHAGDRWHGRPFGPPPGAPLGDLAKTLGVTEQELRDALGDFHARHESERRDEFAAALAKALGKSTAEVEAALHKLREDHLATFAKRLADELGLDVGDVQAALQKVGRPDRHDPREFLGDLASELGVGADRLERALRDARPHRFGRGPDMEPLRDLAKALDVTPAQLQSAFRELWRSHRPDEHRDDLAKFLADRFHLSVDTVEKALEDALPMGHGPGGPGPPPGGPPGPGRPGGPGGPGGWPHP